MIELAASILAADFAHLADEIAAAERGGATILHVDVMDGHFVPNITFGPPVVKAIRPVTRLPLDCHMMVENPDDFIEAFAEAGAGMMSVHQEVCRHLHRTLQQIAHHGMQPAVVINPATPVETLIEVLPMVHHVLVMSVNPPPPASVASSSFPSASTRSLTSPSFATRWASTFASKSTAELLTTQSLWSSKQERTC